MTYLQTIPKKVSGRNRDSLSPQFQNNKTSSKKLWIIKESGKKEKFDKRKIKRTSLRAGASKKFAGKIADEVEKKVYDGMKSRDVLKLTLKLLKGKPEIASRYNLKQAIMNLGPSGFPFEEFFSQVLKNYGYETEVGRFISGKNVKHEIDIVAKKEENYMIECKYHNKKGIYSGLKVAMYTYARFLDVRDNSGENFNSPWLVTNTRCSLDAVNYAESVNLKITSWQYPKNENLQKLIKDKALYPITILSSVKGFVKERLSESKIILAKSLIDYDLEELKRKTNLQENILKKLKEEAEKICWGCEDGKNK